jgi:predicted transcriptional regulator
MAKASRSNKKQPDFDPSEIEDLIFSPAVGKGVGSHLVTPVHVTTVVTPVGTTPTLNLNRGAADMSTVATSATIESPAESSADVATVVPSDLPTVVRYGRPQLWITENGDLVSAARVRRIRLAQDVINSAEESVYDTLWNAKLMASNDRESSRLVQAGYDYLVKRTRLSRKTIQRIIAKLLEKDFIAVETRADIYQRTATVYRVFSYKAVLDQNTRKGRLYVAKMGPGFSYARPLDASQPVPDMATVDTPLVTPIVNGDTSTVDRAATVTVVKTDRPTVVKMSPHLLDSKNLDKKASSSSPAVRNALANYGRVDDDILTQLIAACRSYAPDCTDDEIVHFVHEKGQAVKRRDNRVQNPLGFLLTAVPKCFSPQTLQEFRAEQSRESRQSHAKPAYGDEDPALQRWRREQEAALSDPSVSEQEKHLIRLCLGLNPG